MGKLFEDFEFYDVQATRKEILDLKDEVSGLKDENIGLKNEVGGLKDENQRYRELLEENGIAVN